MGLVTPAILVDILDKIVKKKFVFEMEEFKKISDRLRPWKEEIDTDHNYQDMIIKAVGLDKGSWFECPNGHPYVIGECGGAMETSRCPECNETIGGE